MHHTTVIIYLQALQQAYSLQAVAETIRSSTSTLMMADDDGDSSIPMKYINNTGNVDFQVVVFCRNYNTRDPNLYSVAWQVFRGQSSVDFSFSRKVQVGAHYKTEGQIVRSGPFDAEPGSTWRIIQDRRDDTAILKKVTRSKSNQMNSIVVESTSPKTWNGRLFQVGIYKNGKLLLVHNDVHVGNQVDFLVCPILFFGIVRNVNVGDNISVVEISSNLKGFDLKHFPDGMEVTLDEEPSGGRFKFTAVNKCFGRRSHTDV